MVSKIKVDEIESSQSGGDITFNTLPKIGGVSNFGRKNYIINGNFDIWQRGTSFSWTGSSYSVDRWRSRSAGGTIATTRNAFTVGQTDVPNNPKYYTDITITGSPTSSYFEQRIEDVYTLAGETVTISFWAKYTTNAPTDFKVNIIQNFGSGGSTAVTTAASSASTLTTSWQQFTVTISVPSISGKTVGTGSYLTLRFEENAATSFDAQLAQVQVEKGSVATDFEVRPIGEELHLCKRYYQIIAGSSTHSCGIQPNITDNQYKIVSPVVLPVELRGLDGTVTIPSTTSNFSWQEATNQRTSIGSINTNNGQLLIHTSWTGTSLDAHTINITGDIEIDAEL